MIEFLTFIKMICCSTITIQAHDDYLQIPASKSKYLDLSNWVDKNYYVLKSLATKYDFELFLECINPLNSPSSYNINYNILLKLMEEFNLSTNIKIVFFKSIYHAFVNNPGDNKLSIGCKSSLDFEDFYKVDLNNQLIIISILCNLLDINLFITNSDSITTFSLLPNKKDFQLVPIHENRKIIIDLLIFSKIEFQSYILETSFHQILVTHFTDSICSLKLKNLSILNSHGIEVDPGFINELMMKNNINNYELGSSSSALELFNRFSPYKLNIMNSVAINGKFKDTKINMDTFNKLRDTKYLKLKDLTINEPTSFTSEYSIITFGERKYSTSAGLHKFGTKNKSLEFDNVGLCPVSHDFFAHSALILESLIIRNVEIRGCLFTEKTCNNLGKVLKVLIIEDCRTDDTSILKLVSKCTKLTKLSIDEPNFLVRFDTKIDFSKCGNTLIDLKLANIHLTTDLCKKLADLKNLESLELDIIGADNEMKDIEKNNLMSNILNNSKNTLKKAHLKGYYDFQIPDQIITSLKNCSKITNLQLRKHIGDNNDFILPLSVQHLRLHDFIVPRFENLENLISLELIDIKCSTDHLQNLFQNLEQINNLQVLKIINTKISKTILKLIGQFRNLKELSLIDTDVFELKELFDDLNKNNTCTVLEFHDNFSDKSSSYQKSKFDNSTLPSSIKELHIPDYFNCKILNSSIEKIVFLSANHVFTDFDIPSVFKKCYKLQSIIFPDNYSGKIWRNIADLEHFVKNNCKEQLFVKIQVNKSNTFLFMSNGNFTQVDHNGISVILYDKRKENEYRILTKNGRYSFLRTGYESFYDLKNNIYNDLSPVPCCPDDPVEYTIENRAIWHMNFHTHRSEDQDFEFKDSIFGGRGVILIFVLIYVASVIILIIVRNRRLRYYERKYNDGIKYDGRY